MICVWMPPKVSCNHGVVDFSKADECRVCDWFTEYVSATPTHGSTGTQCKAGKKPLLLLLLLLLSPASHELLPLFPCQPAWEPVDRVHKL